MLFRFVAPSLAKLDELDTEVLVATVHSDVRPARGVVGLCDFRMGGRISKLLRTGFVSGARGEVVMVPGKPFLSFDKILLFGAGPIAEMDLGRFDELVKSFYDRLARLRARVAVVELPGRAHGSIPPNDAGQAVLREAQRDRECDWWTLVESLDGRAVIEALVQEQRRRVRRGI
ncbi:MAG: leucyl aminopeptidase [Polyangiaceae bacterium]|nr:leucyl aminopeptidase [Polyangiaceae bacterium]